MHEHSDPSSPSFSDSTDSESDQSGRHRSRRAPPPSLRSSARVSKNQAAAIAVSGVAAASLWETYKWPVCIGIGIILLIGFLLYIAHRLNALPTFVNNSKDNEDDDGPIFPLPSGNGPPPGVFDVPSDESEKEVPETEPPQTFVPPVVEDAKPAPVPLPASVPTPEMTSAFIDAMESAQTDDDPEPEGAAAPPGNPAAAAAAAEAPVGDPADPPAAEED